MLYAATMSGRFFLSSLLLALAFCATYSERACAQDLSTLEQGIVRELNVARTDPARYSAFLLERRAHYNGKRIERAGKPTILTEEGVAAIDEAIAALRRLAPRTPLTVSAGMSRGARDHARDIGPAGAIGHRGLRGSWPTERVNRYGEWRHAMGEAISYGPSTAPEVVVSLIVDDGVPSRAHRRSLLDPAFRVVGVACGPHARYEILCVLTFAGAYVEGHGTLTPRGKRRR